MDELSMTLAAMGRRIADTGCSTEPAIGCLAKAATAIAPLSANVLACEAEPEVVRSRAFLKVVLATEQLAATERRRLADTLARIEAQPVQAPQSIQATQSIQAPESMQASQPVTGQNQAERPFIARLLPLRSGTVIGGASKI